MIQGTVELSEVRYGRRRMLLTRISDGTGFLTLRFFHFSAAQLKGFETGTIIRAFGEVRAGPNGVEMMHPEYKSVADFQPHALCGL